MPPRVSPLPVQHVGTNAGHRGGAAHLHGVGELAGKLTQVVAGALLASAEDGNDEGAADNAAVRPEGKRAEDV